MFNQQFASVNIGWAFVGSVVVWAVMTGFKFSIKFESIELSWFVEAK